MLYRKGLNLLSVLFYFSKWKIKKLIAYSLDGAMPGVIGDV